MKQSYGEMHLIMTCCANDEEAQQVSRLLIAERLAACVNILPVQSIYRWKGEVVEEGERLLFIKTHRDLVSQLQQRIKEIHSYDLPEIVSFTTTGVEETYLNWLVRETKD